MNKLTLRVVALAAAITVLAAVVVFGPVVAGFLIGFVIHPQPAKTIEVIHYVDRPANTAARGVSTGAVKNSYLPATGSPAGVNAATEH